MAISVESGVLFSEDALPGEVQGRLEVELSGQNKTIADVKRRLADEAKALGANGIANFEYVQKGHRPLQQVLSFRWDTESQWGFGLAVRIPAERMSDAANGATS